MLNHFLEDISSYDGNVLLAAIVSLLLVILFVLLLHVYAKWFLAQARQRRSRSSMSVSHVLLPAHRFHHFHSFNFDNNTNNNMNTTTIWSSLSKGLEASLIASIPLFVYTSSEYKQGLECVICLSAFEESDVGRSLPKCGHAFHVECIDMWLQSHSNCPICRAPVFGEKKVDSVDSVENNNNSESINSIEAAVNVELLEIVVEEGEPRVERLNDASNCDHEVGINDSLSASASGSVTSSSSSSSSSLGCSLKRMLSRNRSDQCKFFRSSTGINVN